VYALYERCGAAELLAAMELAQAQGAFGAAYLGALVSAPVPEPPPPAAWLVLPDEVPSHCEIDRDLSAYEAYVWALDVQPDLEHDHELALNGRCGNDGQTGVRRARTTLGAAGLAPGGGGAARLARPCGELGAQLR
jgi:hypothetical protein